MSANNTFPEFADRLLAGEDVAARQLLARYSAQLIRLVRSRLGPRLRAKEDPEDVLQSVLRTFFRRLDAGDIDLEGWGGLWGLLSLMALRKCQHREERYRAAKRDVCREVSLTPCGGPSCIAIPDRQPTPQEASAFTELIEGLLQGLDERDRGALEGLLAGEATSVIARRLGCSERTVQRTLLRVRQRLAFEEVTRGEAGGL